MQTKLLTTAPERPPADLVNRAELIERRARELEQQTSEAAIQQHQLDAQQAQQQRTARMRMVRTIADARHLQAEHARKVWVRRGLVFAGGFLLGILIANEPRPKPKASKVDRSPRFNRRQLTWLAKRMRSRR